MSLNKLGKALKTVRAIRVYKNGSGEGFVWLWFNPLSWIFAPVLFILSIILEGVPETWRSRSNLGFGIDPYFKKHPEKLIWKA